MAEWQKLRKLLLEQGVTGEEIAATLEAIDNRTRTGKPLDKRASLEAMYDGVLDRMRADERYADKTDAQLERAAGQYFRNTVKMGATPRGRALMERLGAMEATEFAADFATVEEAATAAGIEAEVIETQTRPMREASPEEVAAGRPVRPSPSFAGSGRRGIRSATPTAPWAGETVPSGIERLRTVSPDPPTRTLMTRGEPVFGPAASVLAERQAEQARRRGVEAAGGRNRSRGDREAMPILDPWETGDALDQMMAEEAAGGRTPYDDELDAAPGWAGDRGLTDAQKLASMTEDQPWPDLDSLADGPVNTGRSIMETGPIEIAEGAPEGGGNVMRLGDTAYVRGDDGEWQAVPEMGGAAERGQAALSADIAAWPNPRDPENARRIAAQAMAQAAGGPSEMVKQAQGDNAAASKDNAAAQQATQPPAPGKGYSNSEIAGMVVGGAGLAAAIGNTIADFRTTRGLEKQLAASAAGATVARQEGALGGAQAQRNIMATSLGRRDISPALALRNAQMTGSRAMSDIYGRAAVESARERREAEKQLAGLRKRRWNTLFSGLTQAGATVGSFLTAEGAAQTGAAKRGAGGGNGGR
ncbi:MAG: hypothetical protein GY772_20990 [bacterium]|nr:hypothetical protein [bacterium]